VVPYKDKPTSLAYRWGFFERTPEDYLRAWPVTGLLVARGDNILFERYQYERTSSMRLTSWSMAKSVTSLLLGICLDMKLIDSYDDPADKYVPSLKGTLHGGISLRHLSNMSSGADVLHERDNPAIYPAAFMSKSASIANTVAGWNRRREDPGTLYNYNELCPLTLGMVIRQVSGKSMAAFAEKVLWQAMGAEADATWTTDSERNEFNCIGFAARLRDWARLGRLVAQKGSSGGRQVVSEAWIHECTHWGERDRQCRYDVAGPGFGYKAHMWHAKADGSRLYFNGHHGQRVLIDMPTQTVLVQTAVDHAGPWQKELFGLFEAATRV
jgi:CubicO group peptidase (beta-lactamase class C family)